MFPPILSGGGGKVQGGNRDVTQEFLQDAVVADLEQLFQGETLKNSAGEDRRIRVYHPDPADREGGGCVPGAGRGRGAEGSVTPTPAPGG